MTDAEHDARDARWAVAARLLRIALERAYAIERDAPSSICQIAGGEVLHVSDEPTAVHVYTTRTEPGARRFTQIDIDEDTARAIDEPACVEWMDEEIARMPR